MVLSLGDVSILLLLNFRSGELALQKRLILGKLREILRKLLLRFHQPKVSKLYWKMIPTKWLVSDQELNDFHDSLKWWPFFSGKLTQLSFESFFDYVFLSCFEDLRLDKSVQDSISLVINKDNSGDSFLQGVWSSKRLNIQRKCLVLCLQPSFQVFEIIGAMIAQDRWVNNFEALLTILNYKSLCAEPELSELDNSRVVQGDRERDFINDVRERVLRIFWKVCFGKVQNGSCLLVWLVVLFDHRN